MFCTPHLREVHSHELLEHLFEHQLEFEAKMTTAINSVQDTINTVGGQMTDLATTLTADVTAVGGELAGNVDTSKLTDGLNALQTAAAALHALVPAPAAPVDTTTEQPASDAPTDGTADPNVTA